MPSCTVNCCWELMVDTCDPVSTETRPVRAGEPYDMLEHSAVLFREVKTG
ncbi:MAG: hypothetical protein JOZ45_23405 [Acidobacteriaceae bacterium]|nr:hypothetical protein [Acidobacteriaceae bacterium]